FGCHLLAPIMCQIAQRPKRVPYLDDNRLAGIDFLRDAMKDDTRCSSAHGVSDEAVTVVTLSFQSNKHRVRFSFGRIRHNLTEAHLLSTAQDLAARGGDEFLLAPIHPSRFLCADAPLRFFSGNRSIVKMDLLGADDLVIFVPFAGN